MFNKKIIFKTVSIVACCALAVSIFASCNNKSSDEDYNVSYVPFESKSSVGVETTTVKVPLVKNYDNPKSYLLEDVDAVKKFYEENKATLDFTSKSDDFKSFDDVYNDILKNLQMHRSIVVTVVNGASEKDAIVVNNIERQLNRLDVTLKQNISGDKKSTWIFINEIPREIATGVETVFPSIK